NAAAAAAVSNLSLALKDSDAKIDIGTLPSVVGDKNQLTQLFQNLIANALKFHSDKPIEMKIEAVERGDDWLFSAKDNGIGLDMKFA
ncbi:ATP-binding protein, partial [Acinetobacter baumannii]